MLIKWINKRIQKRKGEKYISIDEIYKSYGEIVYKYLLRLSHDAFIAEELTQETFYQVIKSIHTYNGSCAITTWMCQIAKHLWYQEMRKMKKQIPMSDSVINQSDHLDIEKDYIDKESAQTVMNCIGTLGEEEQVIVLCRSLDGLSFKAIGQMLGKSENWTRVTYFRAKKKIRRHLNE